MQVSLLWDYLSSPYGTLHGHLRTMIAMPNCSSARFANSLQAASLVFLDPTLLLQIGWYLDIRARYHCSFLLGTEQNFLPLKESVEQGVERRMTR